MMYNKKYLNYGVLLVLSIFLISSVSADFNVSFSSPTPATNSYQTSKQIYYNVTTSTARDNATVYLYYANMTPKTSIFFNSSQTAYGYFTVTDGNYYINATALNTTNVFNYTELRNITVYTLPTLLITSPSNNSQQTSKNITIVLSNRSVVSQVVLYLYNSSKGYISNATFNRTDTLSATFRGLSDNRYYFNASINDSNWVNWTGLYTILVYTPQPPQGVDISCPSGDSFCNVIEGAGAGLGAFISLVVVALPSFLLSLAVIIIISSIGFAVVILIRKFSISVVKEN